MQTYRIGITGGIGSGKTTVCRILEILGLPVYYSDLRARQLIESDPRVRSLYKRLFGDDVYASGQLNRPLVAAQLFNNPMLKTEVEKVVHPIVRSDFEEWVLQQKSSMVINEAAIMFESGSYRSMDAVILVTAPEQVRIQRVMKRDGLTKEQVLARIKMQWSEEKKRTLSQYIVECDDVQMVIPQVLDVHQKILSHLKHDGS